MLYSFIYINRSTQPIAGRIEQNAGFFPKLCQCIRIMPMGFTISTM